MRHLKKFVKPKEVKLRAAKRLDPGAVEIDLRFPTGMIKAMIELIKKMAWILTRD